MSDIFDKYRKVKTLARRGATEGERQAAQAAIERMEQAHPELKGRPRGLYDQRVRFFREVVSGTAANSNTVTLDFSRYWD